MTGFGDWRVRYVPTVLIDAANDAARECNGSDQQGPAGSLTKGAKHSILPQGGGCGLGSGADAGVVNTAAHVAVRTSR